MLDETSVSRALFHPRPEYPAYIPTGMPTETDCSGAVMCGYLHEQEAGDALLLFFHGNGETAADYDSLSHLFTACGLTFWVVDYRGYGRSTGTPSFSAMLDDAETLFDDIPRIAGKLGRSFKHVLVMGRSLGSASAIHLASVRSPPLNGMILDSPYADGLALIRRLGGPRLERSSLPGFRDNLDKIRQCKVPALIIHGTDDHIIPFGEAEALYAACAGESRELISIEGAGHNNLLIAGLEDYRRALIGFVDRTTGRLQQ